MKVKLQKTASAVVELTHQSAVEAPDSEMLQLQLLEIVRQFVEAVAKLWEVNPNTLQVTVEKERVYEINVDKFHVVAVSSAVDHELETTADDDGPLTLLKLQSKMALLGFRM